MLAALLAVSACEISTSSAQPAAATRSVPNPVDKPPYTAAISHPRADPYYPAEGSTSLDALHYGLDLTWDGDRRELTGTATIRFRATRDESRISLDLLSALHVAGTTLDGATVPRHHSGHKLSIAAGALTANSRHTLVIRYRGKPHPVAAPATRKDIPDLGWTVQPNGQAWTLQEPFGAFTWYPVNDQPSDKAFYDITWHTKSAWRGVSNGQLISDTTAGGQRAMHWRLNSPASSYLVTAAIGPYRPYEQTGPHGLPITYWVRDADTDRLSVLRQTPALLRWLEARVGPYPFDRIGVVVAPTDSSVETQTMVTIGPGVLKSPFGEPTLLHELSHQWYGDAVTPYTWNDLWLNESFAMYLEIRWEIAHYGTGAYWHRTLNREDQKLRRRYGPPDRYDRTQFASLNVYYCGARMLYRLQSMLGKTRFAAVLRNWPQQRRFGSADTSDWINYLDRTTHRNLRPFAHNWLDSKKSPA